jgi:hypothetical protein
MVVRRAVRRQTYRRRVAVTTAACFGALVALVGVPRAEGASFTCYANGGVSTPARESGVTEPVGDMVLNCTGGTPTAQGVPIPAYDVTLLLNTLVTSRLLASTWGEPLLLLDEPPHGSATLCASATGVCSNIGNGTGDTTYYVRGGGQNVDAFQGQVGPSSITFKSVPIDPPPTNGSRVLRIANVRVNASLFSPSDPSGPPTPVVATIDIPSQGAVALPNPTQTLAFVQQPFTFAVLTAAGDASLPGPVALASCADSRMVPVATLGYEELFATAFKRRNTATSLAAPTALADQNALTAGTYNTETAFYDHGLVGNTLRGDVSLAGLADAGTRLKATFTNVPAGAHLFVDAQSSGGGATVAQLTATETGAYSPAGTGAAPAEVPIVDGTGTAVWEVLASDENHFDNLRLGVYVEVPGNTATAGGTAALGGDLAPTSSDGSASAGPVPRFASTSTAIPLFSMPACQPPSSGPPPDTTAPVVQSASAAPKTFRIDARGTREPAATARVPKGTTLRYSLSEAGRAVFTVRRATAGRRSGRRCIKPTRTNRKRKRCVRYVFAGRFAVESPAGANRHRFSGRIGAKRLRPDRYHVTLVATDRAGNRSAARRFGFRVVS